MGNAILPDWLRTVLDIVGYVSTFITMIKWTFKHRALLRKASYVAVIGLPILLIVLFPSSISVSHAGMVPVGKFTSNSAAYGSVSYGDEDSIYNSWILFLIVPMGLFALTKLESFKEKWSTISQSVRK